MIASLSSNGGSGGGGGGGSGGVVGPGSRVGRSLALHRSNSSLELPHSPDPSSRVPETPLRREYGSHGSIDVVAQSVSMNDNLLAMLQDFRPGDTTMRSPMASELLVRRQSHHHHQQQQQQQQHQHHHHHHHHHHQEGLHSPDVDEVCGPSGSSPKLRLKLNRLWGSNKPTRGQGPTTALAPTATVEEQQTCTSPVVSADVEERHRRRAFAHYDCQSLTANLGYAAKLRGILLARRRNTATGASAASAFRASTPDEAPEEDAGDGKGNELLESCPFFRNETGGEGEREVGLTRRTQGNGLHRPVLAYGVSVLEPAASESLWKHTCPLQKRPLPIESIDEGAYYYRRYFLGREHQNWFGMDEQLGPVAISIRRDGQQYRIVVRTSELLTLRGSVPEEALAGARPQQARIPTREILELVAPEVQMNCLRLGTPAAEEALARLDEQGLSNRYKVGVLYCRAGQRTEEEMYNNQHAGPAFLEFLDSIGQRIRLRGFEGYKAGLDTRTDSTGTHAVAATHRGAEVTFHVSTMLPFTPNNRQQLLRKRHIGNDIVTIVFQEPGALPFSPRRIRSQFQHVFIIVRAISPCTDSTQYSVSVSRSKEVPVFGPPVPSGATFPKGKHFADFILAKVINAENAAHRSEKFATMATRTRQEYLKDLATNYSSTTFVETGQKFSMLSFSSKKKAATRPRLSCDASQRGAICWQVILEDSNQNTDCYLGISIDTIVLIEEHSRQIVFVTPCMSVLGWHAQTNSLRLYHHQGECITIHVRGDYGDRDELMEIVARLRAVTQGAPASELSLKRNALGQLGFHVQPDGVVTQVESMGSSWQAGLRQGSRLVEICKVAVSTLSHDQMVDLLKTSAQVTVTVIPPANDGAPRRGCTLQNCQYLSSNYEGDYENVTNPDNTPGQQTAMPHQRRYDRSFSPPRSSNSSGYGTGSSSRSFNDPRFPIEGTMTSSSSGHSSTDDRWYELVDTQEQESTANRRDGTPPPLPARQNYLAAGTPCKANSSCPAKKDKESHYATGKNYDNIRHHNNLHNHEFKESNYVSPRAIQESIRHDNYQRLESVNRNQEHVSTSYVKLQKEKYETKQENIYASQRELHKNEGHQKLSVSNSLPLVQNANYNLPKSGSNNNLVRYTEFEQLSIGHNENKVDRGSKSYDVYEDNKAKNEDIYERRRSKYETADMLLQQMDLSNERKDEHEGQQPQEFKVGEKVTCLKTTMSERPVPHKVSIEYRPKDFTSSLPPEVRITDGNATDISTLPSEDELSNGSGNVSPRLRRANKHRTGGNMTPSSTGSRNQSPRPKSGARNSHRNSANLTSSTLQEDLMKLINPDYIVADGHPPIINQNAKNKQNISNKVNNNLLEIQNRCRSRENLCGNSASTLSVLPNGSQENGNPGSEVILTMARPATVISNASTASSPAPSENKMTKEERLSPRVTKTPQQMKPQGNVINKDIKSSPEIDADSWITNHQDDMNNRTSKHNQEWSEERLMEGLKIIPTSVTDLQSHLSSLEMRAARETRRRLSLEDEVRRLRDENRRLQDENHAATQHIKRFTEWFMIYYH
ncbi:PREDICTED: signal-induced proliferation-associated 1-like protein 1 [Ceratosolen solmsi marchali]|uniref:Signal-induced proliferation-associated 1-like protein 1 n=1 Tax=Ceratosolen solmsi marchali TaxID=326594 RepID=A0AAJ6YU35_9HYME|nr:PREDICTED: signal-induced proliferation-associated 1-like protein 1 [Ceratosolen solmsi marchali]